jgi:hypothetical protein
MICIKTDEKLDTVGFYKVEESRADGRKTESYIVF